MVRILMIGVKYASISEKQILEIKNTKMDVSRLRAMELRPWWV